MRSVRETLLPTLPEIIDTVRRLRWELGAAPGAADSPEAPAAEFPAAQQVPVAPPYWPAAVQEISKHSLKLGALLKEAELVSYNRTKLVLGVPENRPFHRKELKKNETVMAGIINRVGGEKLVVEVCGLKPIAGAATDAEPVPELPPAEDVPTEEEVLKNDPLIRQITSMFKGELEKVHD